MFCKNCGAQIKDGAKFCPKCGTPAGNTNPKAAGRTQTAKKPPYLAIGLVAAVAVVAVIILFFVGRLIFGKGYEKPIKTLAKGIEQDDGEIIQGAFTETALDWSKEYSGLSSRELEKNWSSSWRYNISGEDLEDEDIKVKYKIVDVKKLDKDDIKDLKKEQKESYGFRDDITAARELDVVFTVYVDGDEEEETDMTVTVIKVDGKWYIGWGTIEY